MFEKGWDGEGNAPYLVKGVDYLEYVFVRTHNFAFNVFVLIYIKKRTLNKRKEEGNSKNRNSKNVSVNTLIQRFLDE